MKYDYFEYTSLDRKFYEEHLANRLPSKIIDAHTHINLMEHLKDIPRERLESDWALQSGMHMTADDAQDYYRLFFPDKEFALVSFPFPIKEADMESNNAYVAECKKNGKIAHALMCVKPEYSCAYIEKEVREKGFSGFKPYPDMVSGQKGADISIFQFWPHEQIALAERLGLPVVLHLPRPGRMADENNIRELLEIRRKYPNLKLIIAHFGRCFMTPYFCSALDQLGEDAGWFYYDTAAVMNPEVLRIGLEGLPHDHILFGMDQPIFLWHGYRRWTDSTYENVVRERLPWCKGHESADKEEKYTLFIYEQMNNILNTIEAVGGGSELVEMIFHGNAEHVFSCK